MLEANFKAITNDVDVLVKDAQVLFQAAASVSGEKADDLRKRGMLQIDKAVKLTQELQSSILAGGKEVAASADSYVRTNPWRVVATAGGLGLLAGLILSSR